MRRAVGLLTAVLRCIALLLAAGMTLATVGAFVPGIPFFSSFGAILFSLLGGYVVVVFALAAAACLLRWRRSRSRPALAGTLLSAIVAVGAGAFLAVQVDAARDQGAQISVARAFWPFGKGDPLPPTRRFVYARHGDEPLEILGYFPAPTARPAPLLVYVHGGGWITGDNAMRSADMRWFAARGYLVLSVGYALSSERRHLWDVTEPQIGCALAWTARNAARLGGDPARIGMIGDSAGGNLVINASYSANTGRHGCGNRPPRIAATVALYPVVDVASFHDNPEPLLGAWARSMASAYIGGSPRDHPRRYAAVASLPHLDRKAPPTLLVVGEADRLVPPEPSYAFVRAAAARGTAVQLVRMPLADHAFDAMPGSIANQMVRSLALRFLAGHGLAPAGR